MSDFIIATDNPKAWHKAGHEIFVFNVCVLELFHYVVKLFFILWEYKLRYFYLKIHLFPPI